MKNLDVVMAYQALQRLKEQPMNLQSSYQLLRLMQKLHEGYALYSAAEKKLIEDMGLIEKVQDGRIVFGSGPEAVEAAKKYTAEHDQLDNMESEIQLDHKIRITDTVNIKINMKDLCALEDFVDFAGMEEGCACDEGCSC